MSVFSCEWYIEQIELLKMLNFPPENLPGGKLRNEGNLGNLGNFFQDF